jgi:spore coat protein A
MFTRRRFLQASAVLTGGLLLPTVPGLRPRRTVASDLSPLDPLGQPKFVRPVPVPPVIDATAGGTYELEVRQAAQWLGLVDPVSGAPLLTDVWGYEGAYPGPTFVARRDVPVQVTWRNGLVDGAGDPLPHLLPVDTSIHWAFGDHGPNGPTIERDGVPIVTHLHGGHTASSSDGLPDAWFTPGAGPVGRLYNPVYVYDNDQEAGTLWYHDHALGITRLNVYAGLAGFYLLRDENEDALVAANAIPSGPYELGLAIQDRSFHADGSLRYPGDPDEDDLPAPSIQAEFFGDHILVNGMAWPYLDVEPRPYRLRLLNGADSRFFELFLSDGRPFAQIGTDLGLLDAPVVLDRLVIGPGERADVVVDFGGAAGATIVLRNRARSPFPKGDTVDPRTTGEIMAFRVVAPLDVSRPVPVLPANLRPVHGPIQPLGSPARRRQLLLFEGIDEHGRLKPQLGTTALGGLDWGYPVTEDPGLDDVEIWDIHNSTEDAHPIHLHLVAFQVLGRQKFKADQDEHTGALSGIRYLGQQKPPERNERGWKDTVQMFPGDVTRVIARFDRPGEYVWHCHILSHEDHEMMRPYVVG